MNNFDLFLSGSGVTTSHNQSEADRDQSGSSSRGCIPKAKIRTIKMTLVIVLSEYQIYTRVS